jgi:hypothetical protein
MRAGFGAAVVLCALGLSSPMLAQMVTEAPHQRIPTIGTLHFSVTSNRAAASTFDRGVAASPT